MSHSVGNIWQLGSKRRALDVSVQCNHRTSRHLKKFRSMVKYEDVRLGAAGYVHRYRHSVEIGRNSDQSRIGDLAVHLIGHLQGAVVYTADRTSSVWVRVRSFPGIILTVKFYV